MKAPRPFREVLSYEFWVLSCLAQFLVWLVYLVCLVGGTEAEDGLSDESGLFAL
jgi:hypothetical protein